MSVSYAPSVSGNTPFVALCKYLERVQSSRQTTNQKYSKTDLITKYINGYRDMWPQLETALKKTFTPQQKGEDLFQLIRLLLPNLDNTRRAFFLKETVMGKEYIRLAGLSEESKKAKEILNFKRSDPSGKRFGFRKGFETMIFEMLKNRNMKSSGFSIQRINDILDEMTASKDAARAQLKVLFSHCEPLEHKWLIRIILKQSLKLRQITSVVLGALHPMAEEMYSVNRSLEDICMSLYDSKLIVKKPTICLGKPFAFMLSARSNLLSVESDMGNSDFLMEIKFDGERVQCHKNQDDFSYFSRGYNEYSRTYGTRGQQENSLSSYLSKAMAPHVLTCILDGEMMSYDSHNKKFVPKSRSHDLKIRTDDISHQACYVVFDLLYYNGKLLTEKPLLERRRVLESFLSPIEGRVHLSAVRHGKTRGDALDFMNEATKNLEEGLVLKKADGFYVPAEREAGWIKLKRDYMNDVVADLDVIVVGAYYAAGKTTKVYDSFLLAVAEDPETSSKAPEFFYTFGLVHSGLSKGLMETVLARTEAAWTPFDRNKCPDWLKMSSMANCPNVIIEPKNSFIITVKAAELVPTRSFMTECSMRFPRVSRLRFDKPWTDCMRYSELSKLYRETRGTMAVGDLENDLVAQKVKARAKRKRSPQRRITVQLERKIIDVKRIRSDFLGGKEFCIFAEKSVREHLDEAVRKHGGSCVLSPRSSTFMVVADRLSLRIQNILETRDVAKVTWLVTCIDNRRIRDPWPSDYLGMTEATKLKLQHGFDRYGDSYDCNVTEFMLRNMMEDMSFEAGTYRDAWKPTRVLPRLYETYEEEFRKESSVGFAGRVFFLAPDLDIIWKLRIAAAGGVLTNEPQRAHFVVGITKPSDLGDVKGEEKSLEWVEECLDAF